MFAKDLRDHDDTPVEDEVVVLHGLNWSDYQRQLELRGDRSVPRFAYLEGAVEITTPSRPHQSLKSRIGCLVEACLLEKGIEFSTYGSWTREKKEAERLTVQLLNEDRYLQAATSAALPGIDLVQLCSYLDRPTTSQAIREYRAALAQNNP